MPLPIIGSWLAVEDTITSYWCSRCGSSLKGQAAAGAANLLHNSCARAAVRLATVMPRGDLAAKWVATNSIISPAPTNKIFNSPMSGKMRAAIFTAAAAMLTEFSPTAVLVRTSLAMAKVF